LTQRTKEKLKLSFLNRSGHGLEGRTLIFSHTRLLLRSRGSQQPAKSTQCCSGREQLLDLSRSWHLLQKTILPLLFSPHALVLPTDFVLVMDAKVTALETESFCTCTAVSDYCLASAQSQTSFLPIQPKPH